MKRSYDLTEDGYRRKIRASKPEVDESPEQFIVRLVQEQFIVSCPKELAIDLRERAPEAHVQIARLQIST